MNIPISSRWSLHFALMRNALLIVITLISLHFTHVRPTLVRIEQGKPKRFSGGFTFIELVVVLGVMAILMMLVLTLTTQARQQSKRTQCASNLRQIGQAFSAYASENKGYVPRHGSIFGRATPIWNVALAPHLGAPPNFQWHDLGRMSVFRCPTHPIEDIPNGYVLNVFAFETRPVWGRSPPVSMGKLQNTAQLPWLLEASDDFGPSILNPNGAIWVDELHVVHSPETLEQRATFRRHWRKTSNVLFADAHVSFARDGDLPLDVYDDGIRRR